MMVCVVTGGIGSGKSTVCSMMNRIYGSPVYDADSRAKKLYSARPALLEEIERTLGLVLRDAEGRFMPSILAGMIFNDSSALKKVEDLLFPALLDDFNEWKSGFEDSDFVVFESATILEKDFFNGFGDCVLLVDAPCRTRVKRASDRDKVSADVIGSRMEMQPLMNRISDGLRDDRVDFVMVNDSSMAALELKVREFVDNFILKKN